MTVMGKILTRVLTSHTHAWIHSENELAWFVPYTHLTFICLVVMGHCSNFVFLLQQIDGMSLQTQLQITIESIWQTW